MGQTDVPRIGVDLGGTKIEAIALGADGRETFRKRVLTPRGDYDATLAAVAALVRDAGAGTVGVGIPGALSRVSGLVKNANSTWLIGRPLKEDLERALGRPVRIENDANCFALSEAIDGAGKGARALFGVILGTGVGGGIVIDARVLVGRSAKDIASSASEALERYIERLARALAGVINVLDPDVIVLGGGLSNIERLYSDVPRLWARYVFSDQVATRLVRHVHGDSSGVRGAAWLWNDFSS